jgi:hypothetical protein
MKLLKYVFAGFCGIVVVESFMRRSYPDSSIRPSVLIHNTTDVVSRFTHSFGSILAKFTDVYKIIRDLLPIEDAKLIFEKLVDFVFRPVVELIKGYAEYYTKRNILLGLFSSVAVVSSVSLGIKYYKDPTFFNDPTRSIDLTFFKDLTFLKDSTLFKEYVGPFFAFILMLACISNAKY